MANKGSPFEREVCKTLSEWWSGGKADDLYWRTAGSGGRATIRGRKGKMTRSSSGDICATDGVGKPLTDLITFELKRGYSKYTMFDLMDQPKNGAVQKYWQWIEQAQLSATNAGTSYWAIIHRRDGRPATITIPYDLAHQLEVVGVELSNPRLRRIDFNIVAKGQRCKITCMLLQTFLSYVEPSDIRYLLKEGK